MTKEELERQLELITAQNNGNPSREAAAIRIALADLAKGEEPHHGKWMEGENDTIRKFYKAKTGWGCYDQEIATAPEEGHPCWYWSVGTKDGTVGGLVYEEEEARRYVERIHELVAAGKLTSEALAIAIREGCEAEVPW
jgi:hypothetical protein